MSRLLAIVLALVGIATIAVAAGFVWLLYANYHPFGIRVPPASPSTSRTPEVAGVLIRWDFVQCQAGKFWLDGGDVLEFRPSSGGCGDTSFEGAERLSENQLQLRSQPGEPMIDGELIFYGKDDLGEFYAVANRQHRDECPWEMQGDGWAERTSVHLSSGLVLQTATTSSSYPVYRGDLICLNQEGEVVSVEQFHPY